MSAESGRENREKPGRATRRRATAKAGWGWIGILSRWARPSTQAFIAEGRLAPGYSLFDLLHGYVYARFPYLYIGVGTGEHPLTKWLRPLAWLIGNLLAPRPDLRRGPVGFADTYHGKVMPLASAKELVTVNEEVCLKNLEQVIPYAKAKDIILHNPDHIVALKCPCRASRSNPCLPLDVCLIVGEPFASFVIEHHPGKARWLTSDGAQAILQAEHGRGHVHHAFFKDAMLGRFFAICNCCPCCCGAMQAMRNDTPMLTSSGYVSSVDQDECCGCGDCVKVCPFNALSLDGQRIVVDQPTCMGCGVCVSTCETGAISLVRAPGKGEPLEIRKLLESVEP